MTRIAVLCLAVLMTAAPLAQAAAQDRGPRGERRQQDDRPRLSDAEAARRAASGRAGRLLTTRNRGDTIEVVWQYPGGRVAEITVDARTGRVLGER